MLLQIDNPRRMFDLSKFCMNRCAIIDYVLEFLTKYT